MATGAFKRFNTHDHFSGGRKLYGVAKQVEQYLPQTGGITSNARRQFRVDEATQFEPLALCRLCKQSGGVLYQRAKIKIDHLQRQLSGFNLREIEDIIDDGEERFAG